MNIDHSFNELDSIRHKFSSLLTPDNSSVIVSSVSGTRTSNSKYRCAVYTQERLKLIEKSARHSGNYEFDFKTNQFVSTTDSDPSMAIGSFTQRLSELLDKALQGKATIIKR